MHLLWSKGDEAGGKVSHKGDFEQDTYQERQCERLVGFEYVGDHTPLQEVLKALNNLCGSFALALHFREIAETDLTFLERNGQNVGRHYRVLDGIIDADTPDWRHDMGRITDQEQARTIPARDAAGLHSQHRNLLPFV